MRLACVVHRYGADIAGGSEAHCRHIAEHLAANHDVTVLTTCARDHVTWRNEFPPGESRVGPVRVIRFPVARERSLHRFRDVSEVAFRREASVDEQETWFRENGPDAPDLIEHLRRHGLEYDRVIFWAFRYAEVYFGLPVVRERAVLVPTAEEDPVIGFSVLERFFAQPAGFIFLTPEEQTLIERHVRVLPPSVVVGSGLDPAPVRPAAASTVAVDGDPYILYLGRIDPNKGCETLLRHFVRYAAEHPDGFRLVMAGPANMPVPDHPRLTRLGFVDEAARDALLAQAAALVIPSRYESLSLVLLEAWNHGLGAVVNGYCRVLEGQARRSNGALWYRTYDEFAEALERLRRDAELGRQLGQNGLDYVNQHYRWPQVLSQIDDVLRRAVRDEPSGP